MEKALITRKEYSVEQHNEYYEQFATTQLRASILNLIGTIEELTKAYKEDKHLNNIGKGGTMAFKSGATMWWYVQGINVPLMIKAGECVSKPSSSSIVCTAKACARQMIREYLKK